MTQTIKVDGTFRDGIWKIKQYTNKAVDVATIVLSGNTDLEMSDEVKLYKRDQTTLKFGGYPNSSLGKGRKEIPIFSYSYELNRIMPDDALYENKTPEFIVEDLITNYTNFTYSSSTASGVTLSRFPIQDQYVGEIIGILSNLLNWQIKTTSAKLFYFEPKGNTVSSVILTVGTNCRYPNWKKSKQNLASKVKVKGAIMPFNTLDEFNGDNSTKEFTLTYKPVGTVKVEIGGTLKTGGMDGEGKDYYVDTENKKIIFAVAPAAGTNNVDIGYNYEARFVVENEDKTTSDTYGEYHRKEETKYLQTQADMRAFATGYMADHNSPTEYSDIETTEAVNIGESIRIIDSINSVDKYMTITKLVEHSNGKGIITLGDEPENINQQTAELKKRITELEKRTIETTITQKMRLVTGATENTLSTTTLRKTRTIGNSFILDHTTNSALDSAYLLGWQGSAWTTPS